MDVNDPTPNLMVFLIERYYLYKFDVVKCIFMWFPGTENNINKLEKLALPRPKKSD